MSLPNKFSWEKMLRSRLREESNKSAFRALQRLLLNPLDCTGYWLSVLLNSFVEMVSLYQFHYKGTSRVLGPASHPHGVLANSSSSTIWSTLHGPLGFVWIQRMNLEVYSKSSHLRSGTLNLLFLLQ